MSSSPLLHYYRRPTLFHQLPGARVPRQGVEDRVRIELRECAATRRSPEAINSGAERGRTYISFGVARGERDHGPSAHQNFSPNHCRSELRAQDRSGPNETSHPTSFRVRFARTRRGFVPLSHPPISPEERFAKVVKALLTNSKGNSVGEEGVWLLSTDD